MNEKPLNLLDRRAALAGAAGLLLVPLSRTVAASDSIDVGTPGKKNCCGNGPPNVAEYGIGISVSSPDTNGPSVSFDNTAFEHKNMKLGFFWVFVPDQDQTTMTFTYTNNVLKFWTNPTGFTGIVYCVEPNNTLVLTWPGTTQPTYSTRPIAADE
jgi:hypothetical protein